MKRLKTRFSINPQLISIFVFGCSSGSIAALFFPSIGRGYFNLYASDVAYFMLGLQSSLGKIGAVAAISLKNLIPVSIITFFPYILVAYHKRLGLEVGRGRVLESLEASLRLLSFCPIFTYGFAVYGLFIGYLSTNFPLLTALRFILASMIHGWLEILIMLSAGSIGLSFIEIIRLEREEFRAIINLKAVFNMWRWLAACTIIAALVETLVSPLLI